MRFGAVRHLGLCVALLATAVPLPAQPRGEPFSRVHLNPTQGRVGYHMSVAYEVYESDAPPRCFPSNWFAHTWTVTGELPPGITYHPPPDNGFPFSGTPRQPGTWNVTLEAEVGCLPFNDAEHYRRTIQVTFRIDP